MADMGMSRKRARKTLDYRKNNFSFSFDNPAFSDRVLVIETLPDAECLDTRSLSPEEPNDKQGMVEEECEALGERAQNDDSLESSSEESLQRKRSRGEASESVDPILTTAEEATYCKSTGRRFQVNSVVLAAASGFFRSLITSGMRESCPGVPIVVKLTTAEARLFEELLYFLYAGRLRDSMTLDDQALVIDLLLLADRFEVEDLVSMLVDILEGQRVSLRCCCNVLARLPDVAHPAVGDLVQVSQSQLSMLILDLKDFTDQPGFLDMPELAIRVVARNENLPSTAEELLFHALLSWVRHQHPHDLNRRKEVLASLLEDVRLPQVPAEALHDSIIGVAEMQHPRSKELVEEALWFQAFPQHRRSHLVLSTTTHRRYVARRGTEVLRVGGPTGLARIQRDVSVQNLLAMAQDTFFQLQAVQLQGLLPIEGPSNRINVMPSLYRQNDELFVQLCVFAEDSVILAMQEARRQSRIQCRFFVRQKSSHPFYARQDVGAYDTTCFPDVVELELPRDLGSSARAAQVSVSAWSQFTRDNSYYIVNGMLGLRMEISMPEGQF